DDDLAAGLVGGGEGAVEAGGGGEEGPVLDALDLQGVLHLDLDPGDGAASEESGGADGYVGVEDGLDVADEPLVVLVRAVGLLEDAEDCSGVRAHDRLAGR